MSKIYNMIGSLSTLKSSLEEQNIYDFKSLKEVMDFQNSYTSIRQQLISNHKNLIKQEEKELALALQQLETEIDTQKQASEKVLKDEIEYLKNQLNISIKEASKNLFQKIIQTFKQINLRRQLRERENNYDQDVKTSISILLELRENKNNRYQFITTKFNDAVEQSAQKSLLEIERKKLVIDKLNSFIYGALGEQKVVKVLENLSDEYYLINDFTLYFSPAIYNRQEDDYIKSIQIDHILIAPSGIFLIETKNWSEKSLENLSLRSPVQQIRRASFVLFKLLNNEINNFNIHLDNHHWGAKKISIKNLIVLTNTRPKEEFQYVKILTLNELIGYINYFKPIFSNIETQGIAEFLLMINDTKIIKTNRR